MANILEAINHMKAGKRVRVQKFTYWIEEKNVYVQRPNNEVYLCGLVKMDRVMSDKWELL